MAEVATPVVGSHANDDTAVAEVEGADAERSLASSPAVTGPRVREEDITEIVTEEEAKAGRGFFRTSRGALRCGRCRSCSNRSLKRRCDLLEPPRHATGAPSKPRRHPPKPHGDDDTNADADGDADNPNRAFATWQRRTLFEEDENADPAKAKFAWRRVTHARNSRSKMPPMRPDEPAVRTYGSSKQAAQGTGGDPDMVDELAAADGRGVAVVAPAPDLRPLGGAAGGADMLRLARAVMAAAEGRPPPTIASFVDVDDDDPNDARSAGGARPRYSTIKCGVCPGCARGGRAGGKDFATRRCDVYPEQNPEPANDAARRRDRPGNVGPGVGHKRARDDVGASTLRPPATTSSVGWFTCETCGKSFAEKRFLLKHAKTHDADRPYTCAFEGCTMGFLDSSKLKRHWLTHPGVGHLRHMCPYQKCGQAFETAAERASHMGEHTDERYYFCWNVRCNKRFNSREAMEAHMQNVHRNEIEAE